MVPIFPIKKNFHKNKNHWS